MPVYGPYLRKDRRGDKWRMVIVGAFAGSESGQRAISFDSKEECEKQIRLARKREQAEEGLWVSQAITAFVTWQETRRKDPIGSKAAETNRYRLRGLLRDVDSPVSSIDLGNARSLYEKRVASTKGDTHQAELSLARAMWEWLIEGGHVKRNPWADVEPEGKRKRAPKEQLRISDATHLVDVALAEGSREGLAVATTLLLGLRASEVTSRAVRDLDDNGRVLWIPSAKTAAGVRTMGVPEAIREPLLALCEGRVNTEPLFGYKEARKGRVAPVDRHWLHHHMERLSRKAHIPLVTVHSLRGLHSTIATLNEVTPEVVAKALGHASPAVTRRHYIAPGSEHVASAGRAQRRLVKG